MGNDVHGLAIGQDEPQNAEDHRRITDHQRRPARDVGAAAQPGACSHAQETPLPVAEW